MARILLIDDDTSLREVVSFMLTEAGYDVISASNGEQGLEKLSTHPDLVLTDIKMPGMDGMEVLNQIVENNPDGAPPVIVLTAHGTVKQAVEAMKSGAFSYLLKPFARDELLLTVDQALHHTGLEKDNARLRNLLKKEHQATGLVFKSRGMSDLMNQVKQVAGSDATVLITGESGTGKELVCRACHDLSPRYDQPFIPVNCGAIPAELMESELFGHLKGSFTGAAQDSPGKIRSAHGGTLFLDEIAELPLSLQPKLLRVLETHQVDPVGSSQTLDVDFRLVCATHRDLEKEVAEGRFREDLYYRLNVLHLNIPPLRDRLEDINCLWDHFTLMHGGQDVTSSAKLLGELASHQWKGNVRELKNLNQRLVLMRQGDTLDSDDFQRLGPSSGTITPAVQQSPDNPTDEGLPLKDLPTDGVSLVEMEKEIIRRALKLCGGNRSKTALFLSIPRHVLIYRLEKYGF
ncbi:MAG: sigma-54-dependent Fis family transcriptional regulator [bacterium]|nr:sigma-54-dependent Fis family transcriptional regulator [bacterium]